MNRKLILNSEFFIQQSQKISRKIFSSCFLIGKQKSRMNNQAKSNLENLILLCVVCIGLIILVGAYPILDSDIEGFVLEDTSFIYNFTQNVSGTYTPPLVWSIEEINSSEHDFSSIGEYTWISIDSSSGIMTINSTLNNQTGAFNISVHVVDASVQGTTVVSTFYTNATNDAPNFTNIQNVYNLTQNVNFIDYINATDEEGHYPLVFNVTFFGNCTHASWSGRNEGENCTILSISNYTNTSGIINFTPSRDDVGVYWANITVMDFGNSSAYGCPHEYCTESTYSVNKTTLYSSVVRFNVFAALAVNVSDCENKHFQENESGACQINITTKEQTDTLNLSSIASLRSYVGGVLNSSWFLSNTTTTSENFSTSININFTPQKTEIGNWTINLTVQDITTGESSTDTIYVYVNRSTDLNDVPDLLSINDIETSIELLNTITLTVYDTDLQIPHKDSDYGGYNETLTFNVTILNQSDLSQELNISGFDVEILNMPVYSSGVPTNKTLARIQFTPNISDKGDYYINISVTDVEGAIDAENFNLSIISNTFPYWIDPVQNNYSLVEDVNFYFNVSTNVTDDDGDNLTFSYTNDTSFSSFSFNLTSGVINFTPIDEDVGQHLVTITVNDSYLTNSTTFNFTVNNTNDVPVIEEPMQGNAVTVNPSNSNMNTTEDLNATIFLYVQDEDFKIPSAQRGFYNESLTINLTIQGPNSDLFTFNFNQFTATNRSKYTAEFTPNKSDVGVYNVSINVSDVGGLSDFISFNLTINATTHAPVITAVNNSVSSIEESIYQDFYATDAEDGADSEGNLIFDLNFLSGTDFVGTNETIFNTTLGILNYTFNSSQGGIYQINVSVNDTTNRTASFLWNITVYDYPVVLSPASSFVYSMQENVSYQLNFSVNHTVQDELTYKLYIDGVLRNTTSGNGNGTDFLWDFTTNFTDETTCSGNVNLTLNVSNSKLSNTTYWSLEINHTNAPLVFNGLSGIPNANNIGGLDAVVTGGTNAVVNLSSHFTDADASDTCYNQTIGFVTTFFNGTSLGISVVNWSGETLPTATYTHPSTGTVYGNYSLYAEEFNVSNPTEILRTVYANNFTVQLTISTVSVATPSSGGGGGASRKTPVSLKIIVPDPVSSRRKDRLVLPITLSNSGEVDLNNIFLRASVSKDGLLREDLIASFDKSIIDLLKIGEDKNLTLIVDANTEEYGLYEISLNATVENPAYDDWAKIFVNVEETEDILERIIFTEEFLAGNPECVELTELVDEARSFLNAGAIDDSFRKLDEAIEACRIAIEQPPVVRIRNQFEKYLFNYVWIISLFIFMGGFLYYTYRRRKLRRGLNEVKESFSKPREKFNNKRTLVEVE